MPIFLSGVFAAGVGQLAEVTGWRARLMMTKYWKPKEYLLD
ncbi:hypothetical protein OAF62_00220 [Akkermansiaceae bacterium]|nr:hypothetical protein [Akkermansiaceae bacterium]MDB4726829.1 hypothetical protein [bacterium]MDB4576637.1 hypothetical protein [Akkermansiaceae bacterium]MDB4624111.1 hypothetical protein [Akkermansiaceae bacterium]MDB4734133.1 hypothetical protein [Akkermansiaceae bacterium]